MHVQGETFVTKYITLLAVLALGMVMPATAQVTFRFNPPNNTQFVQTDTQTLTEKTTATPTRARTLEVKTKTVIKKTATGFTFTQTPISKTTIIGSKRTTETDDDPAASAPITLVLDANGKAVDVQGFEALKKKMIAHVNDESRKKGIDEKSIRAMFDRIVARQKAEWQQSVALYVGKTVKPGDAWKDATKPDAEGIAYDRVISFGPMKTVAGKKCIRVGYVINSNPASVRAALATLEKARAKALAAQKGKTKAELPKFVSFSAREEGERYIDPATMLVYTETVTSTRTQVVDVPDKGKITVAAVEKKVTKYSFK
jgi:hypothetical protein